MVLGPLKKILGRDGDGGFEFRQNLALQECGADAQRPGNALEDVVEMTRKIGYLTIDETIINLCLENPELNPFLIMFSPLNSTVYMDKHQESLARIRLENFITKMKLMMSPAKYEANGYEILEAFRNYGHQRISECHEGWKGRLCTENVKRTEVSTTKK